MGAWLAVAAGTLGAMMATLDISIVNSALPTIQGEIGASGTEATWIATSFLVAEIVVVPLCNWFEKLLGLRRFLLITAILFTFFSIICGIADNLTTMIIGRAGSLAYVVLAFSTEGLLGASFPSGCSSRECTADPGAAFPSRM